MSQGANMMGQIEEQGQKMGDGMFDRDRRVAVLERVVHLTGGQDHTSHLVLVRAPDVAKLLDAPVGVAERVLGDPRLRTRLVSGAVSQYRATWRLAITDRGRLSEKVWFRRWWLPGCSSRELCCLANVEFARGARRLGLRRAALPASVAAAILYADETHKFTDEVRRHVTVSRGFARNLSAMAHEFAREEGLVSPRRTKRWRPHVGEATPSANMNPMLALHGPGWWHGGA